MGSAFFSSKVEGEQSFLLHECLSFRQQGEVLLTMIVLSITGIFGSDGQRIFQQQVMTMIILSITGIFGSDGQRIFQQQVMTMIILSITGIFGSDGQRIFQQQVMTMIILSITGIFGSDGQRIFQQQVMTMIILSITGIFGSDGQGVFQQQGWRGAVVSPPRVFVVSPAGGGLTVPWCGRGEEAGSFSTSSIWTWASFSHVPKNSLTLFILSEINQYYPKPCRSGVFNTSQGSTQVKVDGPVTGPFFDPSIYRHFTAWKPCNGPIIFKGPL